MMEGYERIDMMEAPGLPVGAFSGRQSASSLLRQEAATLRKRAAGLEALALLADGAGAEAERALWEMVRKACG